MKALNTYALDVLGCKVNQYDARQIARLLEGFGLRPTDGEPADLVVAHTCGVTATAVQKSRQTVRRLARKNPGATVFLTGCAAAEDITDGVDVDVRVAAGAGWVQMIADELQTFSLPNPDFHLPENSDELAVENFGGQTRAFLKIQDGCDAGCAYCIVPTLRKEPRDKSVEAAVAEAKALVKRGYKEIVIAGVHVGLYGRENADVSLNDILARIIEIPNIGRIRMSSLHPNELTEDLLKVWASSPNMMPHLHLSLQSGSDGVLRRMGRGYTAEEYADAVERARAALGNPAITTDVILGFPGETDAEFEETFEFCKRIGFSGMHIFNFSPRPGTRAADMPDPVDPQIAQARHARLAALADEMSLAFNQGFVGQTVEVLVERCKDGVCTGGSKHYIPTCFQGLEDLCGTVMPVKIIEVSAKELNGESVK
jgi:threonylcarbamoyladenosine tRNA methylthiotransferase MtaB